MKTIFFGVFAIMIANSAMAQNKNVKVETKTTTQTTKDSDGVQQVTKSETTKEVQKIELGAQTAGSINVPTKDSPVEVTTTTKVTNPDGSTRTVDVDRSAFYESNGNRYKLDLDANGYIMRMGNGKPAVLRKTSINSYIYNSRNRTSVAYFDVNGNLVIESYDPKSNSIITEKFMLAAATK